MPVRFIEYIGSATLEHLRQFNREAEVFSRTLVALWGKGIFNRAFRHELISQLHEMAVSALPLVTLVALIFGSIMVNVLLSLLTQLGAYDAIGQYLTSAMLRETAPLTCSLLLLLRSGPAVISELGLMQIHNEFKTLDYLGVSRELYAFAPRIMAFAISGPLLALYIAWCGLIGGFFVFGYVNDITFDSYIDQLLYGVAFKDLILMFVKSFVLSLAVGVVCIARGSSIGESHHELPKCIVSGLLQATGVLVVLEALFQLAP